MDRLQKWILITIMGYDLFWLDNGDLWGLQLCIPSPGRQIVMWITFKSRLNYEI